ncbi:hypothetical protein CK203_023850 [Vitis vinifera]|uniref:DUF4283 domain-containing protein n=1 Tax=Vitis vinifera TaxID=29760 RepID=A0A438JA29_VITVI|nr:hypothetical protein CK203_023850 [Vitis vinifera]
MTMAEKLNQMVGFLARNQKTRKERLWRRLLWEDRMQQWRNDHCRATQMSGGEDDLEKLGQLWAKSWDLKGSLGLAKLEKERALLEFEDLEEARRVVSSGNRAMEGIQVGLEHWSPRSGCWVEEEERKEVWWARILVRLRGEFRPSVLEIEVEEEVYAVSLWWECRPVLRRNRRHEAGRHSSEVRGEEAPRAGQRVTKEWVSVRFETLNPSDEGTDEQAETGFLLKCLASRNPHESEPFVAREFEDTRKLQGVVRLTETDRALEEESMRINGCKDLGVIKSSSDKGRGMEGVSDTYDAQVERSEPEGKWEESGLAKFSQFLGFPMEGLEKEILNFLTKIRKRREKIHSKELLEKRLGTGQRAPNCDCPMKVKILSWNVRGANDSSKRKVIKTFIRNQSVDLICIQETKIQSMSDSIARSLGSRRFLDWKAANAEGALGGIFICWDRRGENLLGMGGQNNQTWARLDRFLVSPSWIDQFSGINQCRLSRSVFDHFLITLVGGGIRRGPTPFRFENMWLKVEGFKDLVHNWWQGIDVRGSASCKLATKMKEIK